MNNSEQLKLQRRQHKHEEKLAALALAKYVVTNPVVELISGFMLIQYLTETTDKTKKPIIEMGTDTQIILRTGIVSAVVIQQLGPEGVAAVGEGISKVAGTALKALPALAAAD